MYMPYGALLIEILNTHVYLICDLNDIGIVMTTTRLVLLVCSLKVERKTNDDILLCVSTILVFIIALKHSHETFVWDFRISPK